LIEFRVFQPRQYSKMVQYRYSRQSCNLVRRWYRYHHLFADLLRYRLQREQASTIPELHRRASKWHEEHGFIDRAIRHAIAADDLGQAARLVAEHSFPANERGEVSTVRRWFELLPDERVRSDPSLSVDCAWNLFLSGQIGAVEERLNEAEALLTYSQSGNPTSELYTDQTQLFSNKQWRPILYKMEDINGDIKSKKILTGNRTF